MPDDELKIKNDLWMHQNTLMWGRLQTLILLQGGFLAIGYALANNDEIWILGVLACGIAMGLSLAVGWISERDRARRDNFETPLIVVARSDGSHSKWVMRAAFGSACLVDVSAGLLFWLGPN